MRRRSFLKGIPLLILMSSCGSWSSIDDAWLYGYDPSGCSYYGVAEACMPMGEVTLAQGVSQSTIDEVCAGIMDEPMIGCALPDGRGGVELYWLEGNHWAEQHERCHAEHGAAHTYR